MRINTRSGAWVCMACGAKGGDVVAYEMQMSGMDFVEAAKALGAWVDDGKPFKAPLKPTALSPRQALSALAFESLLLATAAGNIAYGTQLTPVDLKRVLKAAARINQINQDFS